MPNENRFYRQKTDPWKPIDSAPKDGEMILIAHNHWGTINVTLAAWGRVNYGAGQFEDGWRSYSGFLSGAKWWCPIPSVEGLQEKEPLDAPVCAYRIGSTTCGYTLANHHMADGSAMNHLFQPAEIVVSATDEHPAIYKSGTKLVAGAQFHQMSTAQIEVARHALGLPNKMKTSYRNRFVAGIGHEDYEKWVQMVADGHAEKSDKVPFGGDSLFWLTHAGALQAIKKGEKLDPEDFTPKNQGCVKSRLDDGPALPREK